MRNSLRPTCVHLLNISVRPAIDRDSDDVRGVHLAAFPEGENTQVAALAGALLAVHSDPATVALVAEAAGAIVGSIFFSPVAIGDHARRFGYILSPLGVHPECHGRQVGTNLVEAGIASIAATGAEMVLVYGDPAYYGRFGFTVDTARRYTPPYPLEFPHGWQARIVSEAAADTAPVEITCVAALRDPALW